MISTFSSTEILYTVAHIITPKLDPDVPCFHRQTCEGIDTFHLKSSSLFIGFIVFNVETLCLFVSFSLSINLEMISQHVKYNFNLMDPEGLL